MFWAVTHTPTTWYIVGMIAFAAACHLGWRAVLRRRVALLAGDVPAG